MLTPELKEYTKQRSKGPFVCELSAAALALDAENAALREKLLNIRLALNGMAEGTPSVDTFFEINRILQS